MFRSGFYEEFGSFLTRRKMVLRALEREDLKLVHKWQNDEEVMRLTRSLPDHVISMEALESRYEKALKGGDFEERQYIIVEKASNRPIGMARIMITLFWKRATSADIGLMIAEKDCRGKGYGTEVVQLLLKEVFEQLNLHRAAWWTVTSNIPSVALAKKMESRRRVSYAKRFSSTTGTMTPLSSVF